MDVLDTTLAQDVQSLSDYDIDCLFYDKENDKCVMPGINTKIFGTGCIFEKCYFWKSAYRKNYNIT